MSSELSVRFAIPTHTHTHSHVFLLPSANSLCSSASRSKQSLDSLQYRFCFLHCHWCVVATSIIVLVFWLLLLLKRKLAPVSSSSSLIFLVSLHPVHVQRKFDEADHSKSKQSKFLLMKLQQSQRIMNTQLSNHEESYAKWEHTQNASLCKSCSHEAPICSKVSCDSVKPLQSDLCVWINYSSTTELKIETIIQLSQEELHKLHENKTWISSQLSWEELHKIHEENLELITSFTRSRASQNPWEQNL
jgi:hypothetical protein